MISFNAQHTLKQTMQRSYCRLRGAMKRKHSLPIALALLFLGAAPASADWNLKNEQSQLSFVSIKNGDIAEVHRFNQLEGTVDDKGNVQLTIQLASVATAIPIRDQRMQEMLFNTSLFPTAALTATVDADQISMLKAGQMRVSALEGELSLHGQSSPVTAELIVARLTDDTLAGHESKAAGGDRPVILILSKVLKNSVRLQVFRASAGQCRSALCLPSRKTRRRNCGDSGRKKENGTDLLMTWLT